MVINGVPWTLFYLDNSPDRMGVKVSNITASCQAPSSFAYYNEVDSSWSKDYSTNCVRVIGAIRGHHAVTAHIPSLISLT
jgi:hypothetical protein